MRDRWWWSLAVGALIVVVGALLLAWGLWALSLGCDPRDWWCGERTQ